MLKSPVKQVVQEWRNNFDGLFEQPGRHRIARALFAWQILHGRYYVIECDRCTVKTRSTQPTGAGVKVGESAPAVDARTPATFSSK